MQRSPSGDELPREHRHHPTPLQGASRQDRGVPSLDPRVRRDDFTSNGDEFFCREGYVGAEGALAHLQNVGPLVDEALKIADLTRLEIHGPAEELEKLKSPLAAMSPAWFVLECRVDR